MSAMQQIHSLYGGATLVLANTFKEKFEIYFEMKSQVFLDLSRFSVNPP